MKEFNFEEFNVDKTPFLSLTISFDLNDGLVVKEKEQYVTAPKKNNFSSFAPADKCDFISNSGSTHSNNFFEVSGFKTPNDIFFSSKYNYKVSEFLYVLPENKDLVIQEIKKSMTEWIKTQLAIEESAVEKAKSMI